MKKLAIKQIVIKRSGVHPAKSGLFSICYLLFAICRLYSAGTTVGDVLNLNSSVRATSLGQTYLFDDAACGNPAFTEGFDTVNFYFYSSPLGIKILNFGGKFKLGSFTLSGGFFNQNAGDIDVWKPAFEEYPEVKFTKNLQSDTIFTLGAGCAASSSLYSGVNIKYLRTALLEEYNLDAVAFDFGSRFNVGRFDFALLLKNLGADASYSDLEGKFSLPAVYSYGMGYYPSNFGIIISADNIPADKKTIYKTGIEWKLPDDKIYPLNTMVLRGGCLLEDKFDISNLTLGFSLGFSSVLLEYALSPLDDVGLSHNIGLSYRFGHKTTIPEAKVKEKHIIEFEDGKVTEKSFNVLEDIAQTLKEYPNYSVKLDGHLDLIDKILDYFVRLEKIPESTFVVEEKLIPYVDLKLIGK